MSRDNFDIPEVFRRAMEDAGWDDGDEGGNGPRRPFPQRSGSSRGPNRIAIIIGLVILLLLSFSWIVEQYTDWLWFVELNYQSVWLRQWMFRVISFVAFFVIAAAFFLINWHVARRRALKDVAPTGPRVLRMRAISWIINGVGLFLAFGFASSAAGNWEGFLRYFFRVPYGLNDPIFGQDVSFYLFELPVFSLLQQWTLSLLVLTTIGVLAIYALNNLADIQRGQWQPQQSPVLRQHVALLGGLILALWAVGYIFNIYELMYSPRGVVTGASYTDLNASLYALYAQLILMALTAVAVFYNIFRFDLRPVGAAAGLWLAATLLIGGIFPGLLQRYSVDPNEIERESPYIEHNIEFTREAFGLNQIGERQFNFEALDQAALDENEAVLQNIRIWDYRPLLTTYGQLQALTLYYQFNDIDIDRYEVNDQTRQVMLSVRELDKANLPNDSWVNRKLEFTHGYGVVMNPVDRVTPEGQPEFFIQDLPPESSIDLEVTRPEIYYGETTNDVVFVGSDRNEFSYPGDQEPVYSSYDGVGGVPINNYLKRIAFALRFGDANVLLSDEINNNTRVQFNRAIQMRIRQITPFLALDNDPYIVIADGRLVWVQDAYTFSDRFPYSEPLGGVNYIRNAVKIAIDAYDGTVNYYLSDPDDPIIQTYSQAFPGLFKSFDEMPETLQEHLRYPEDLFRLQSERYLSYHMTDVRVFYNQEDRWEIPTEVFQGEEQPMEPYYVLLTLPGEEEPEYLLIQPFTPRQRDNMVGWMAARNDPENYGELVVYQLPRQELVFGPSQIESRIDQDPDISQQFSLWNQSGSSVIRGNLLAIPLNNSFLYVEPIYLQATASALPELRRVIVASDTRIAMRSTLDEALEALLEAEPTAIVVPELEPAPETEGETTAEEPAITATEAPSTLPADATLNELIDAANRHFEAAEQAQRDGDWATYGRELEALQETLQQMSQYIEESP